MAVGCAPGSEAASWLGYLKVFMDGTPGLPDGVDAGRHRRADHERCELAEIVPARRRGGLAGRRARDRRPRNREALDAFEQTRGSGRPHGLRQRIEHAQLLAADDLPRFAELGVTCSVQFSHAPSDRDIADRFWAGTRRLRVPLATRVRGRGRQRQRRADRGARSTRRDPRRRATHDRRARRMASGAGSVGRAGVSRDVRRSHVARASRARPGRLSPTTWPTSHLDHDPWDRPRRAVVATIVSSRWLRDPPPHQAHGFACATCTRPTTSGAGGRSVRPPQSHLRVSRSTSSLRRSRTRGDHMRRRRGSAASGGNGGLPVPRRAARRELHLVRSRSRVATRRTPRAVGQSQVSRSRSGLGPDPRLAQGIPTVGTVADLKIGRLVPGERARRGAGSFLARWKHTRPESSAPGEQPQPAEAAALLYVSTSQDHSRAGTAPCTSLPATAFALRSLLGTSPDESFSGRRWHDLLLWQGKVPTWSAASQLEGGRPRRASGFARHAARRWFRSRPDAGEPHR